MLSYAEGFRSGCRRGVGVVWPWPCQSARRTRGCQACEWHGDTMHAAGDDHPALQSRTQEGMLGTRCRGRTAA
eukprot:4728504-Lingulodinium_polyedra.AAC.1